MSEREYLLMPATGEALIWAPAGDAITDADGNTLVLSASLAQFMEGACATERPVHFCFALRFVRLLVQPAPGMERLAETWAGMAAPSMRNAGALFHELTRALPRVPQALDVRRLCALLRKPEKLAELSLTPRAATAPPIPISALDAHLRRLLEGMSGESIRHWLRHGRGPLAATLPVDLPARVPRAPGVFDDALQRKRLAGVAPFVDQMVSALTLPPRRARQPELPVGGYSSVTNRGHPDQILFSEFAVDELEFLRRFAGNELLYWQREEPQSRVREDLIVLCDQGVRTWGDTRLALTAAAIALGRRAGARGRPARFAATSNDGAPVADNVAELLEASDLSPNPGLALERVLEQPAHEYRDVVLLTHPRSLLDDDVRAAARRAPPHVRLFALAVDGRECELIELRRGDAVSLRRFRLGGVERAETPAIAAAGPDTAWTGPVEPIPHPFRVGIVGSVVSMAMDTDGRQLFTACADGLLHAWSLDGERHELLPRAMHEGAPLKEARALVGVQGGFACLNGRLLAHYDTVSRRVRVTELREAPATLGYLPEYHCVRAGAATIDLDTGGDSERAREAARRSPTAELKIIAQPPEVMLKAANSGHSVDALGANALMHQPRDGRLALFAGREFWKAWTPMADGKPMLKDATVHEACAGDETVAVRVTRGGADSVVVLHGPEWRLAGEFPAQSGLRGLAVSADGTRVAIHNKTAGVLCLERDEPALTISPARHHAKLTVEVGDEWFTAYGGKFTHLVRWDRQRLEVSFLQGERDITEFVKRKQDAAALNPQRVQLRPGVAGLGRYDGARFQRYGYSRTGLLLLVDGLGQIIVLDARDQLVAMFHVYRGTVAAWLPDGTRYGPAGITGGSTSSDALGRIGRALRKAGGNG